MFGPRDAEMSSEAFHFEDLTLFRCLSVRAKTKPVEKVRHVELNERKLCGTLQTETEVRLINRFFLFYAQSTAKGTAI